MSVGATVSGSVAPAPSKMGKVHKRTEEAANPAQQAAIAVSMKKAGKKPKSLKEGRVKQLIMDLRELKDKEFMKKYGKSKEEMKQGLKSEVDESFFDKVTSFIGKPFDEKEIAKDLQNRGVQLNKNKPTPSRGVAEALGLYGPFTVTINTGERPQSRTKTKKFRREDDAILWAQDWLEDAPQYVFATAEVTDPDGNVVWTTDESLEEQGLAEAQGPLGQKSEKQQELINMYKKREEKNAGKLRKYESPSRREKKIQQWIDFARTVDESVYESAILQGMQEARVTEDELLLMPGQGIRFKPELMPKKTDHEVEMARQQLIEIAQNAEVIYELIQGVSEIKGLDAWIQKKIVLANDYMESVSSYLKGRVAVDEQVDAIDQRLTAQYNTPQMKAQSQSIDQAFASGDEREFQRLGIQSPQQIERDYQTMLGKEKEQDAALMRNPKLTPSARPVQRYNPKGVPIKEFDDRLPNSTYVQSRSTLINRDGDENFSKRIATLSTDKHGNQRVRALDTSRDFGDEMTINTNIPKGVTAKIVPQQGDANIEETSKLSAREKLHNRHQELRKKSGLPDPNYYKELKGTFDMPDDERWAKTAELKKKYKVKEEETNQQDQQPQQEPKQGVDVKKGLGLLSTIGRALNTVTSPTFGDDVKGEIRTMIHNKVTGTPNK